MSAAKRPSTSSLRRFITSRPFVTIADIRRRFGLDDPNAMTRVERDGQAAWIGLPEREAIKLQELWHRDDVGMELSVEVHAPVVVGVYPMRIARYLTNGNGDRWNGHSPAWRPHGAREAREMPVAPPMGLDSELRPAPRSEFRSTSVRDSAR
jgi:hypothetical protein